MVVFILKNLLLLNRQNNIIELGWCPFLHSFSNIIFDNLIILQSSHFIHFERINYNFIPENTENWTFSKCFYIIQKRSVKCCYFNVFCFLWDRFGIFFASEEYFYIFWSGFYFWLGRRRCILAIHLYRKYSTNRQHHDQ